MLPAGCPAPSCVNGRVWVCSRRPHSHVLQSAAALCTECTVHFPGTVCPAHVCVARRGTECGRRLAAPFITVLARSPVHYYEECVLQRSPSCAGVVRSVVWGWVWRCSFERAGAGRGRGGGGEGEGGSVAALLPSSGKFHPRATSRNTACVYRIISWDTSLRFARTRCRKGDSIGCEGCGAILQLLAL